MIGKKFQKTTDNRNSLGVVEDVVAEEGEDQEQDCQDGFKRKRKGFGKGQEGGDDQSDNDENDNDKIDFTIKKPGAHAKAGEWRKWKMMQRSIRQEREEKRLNRAQASKAREEKKEEENQKFAAAEQQEQQDQQNGTRTTSSTNGGTHQHPQQYQQYKQRKFSLSIALPSSAIDKVLLRELRACFAGQIARSATLFFVDEIIVYNEHSAVSTDVQKNNYQAFCKVLEYMECPQYLRKVLFPPHRYLEHVGLLMPLEAPHHFKIDDEWSYREGVVTDIPTKDNKGSWVDIGLRNRIQVDKQLQAGIRVTVKKHLTEYGKSMGFVVSPEAPKKQDNLYWGYQVRYCDSFRKVFSESVFNREKYDLKIGMNLSGMSFDNIPDVLPESAKRVLVVYGGASGLQAGMESDEKMRVNNLNELFHFMCESSSTAKCFGSRSMRLEEAVLISLSNLRPRLLRKAVIEEQNHVEEEAEEKNKITN